MTRAADLATALDALDWFQQPHTLDQIIGIYAEAIGEQSRPLGVRHGASVDDILSALANRGGPGGKGGHSDPTATLALWGEPDAVTDDDGKIRTIDNATSTMLADCVACYQQTQAMLGRVPSWRPPPLRHGHRQDTVTAAVKWLNHLAPILADAELVGGHAWSDVLARLRAVAETAVLLRSVCEAIWQASRGDIRPVAVQKARRACENCGGWRTGNVAVTTTGLCRTCDRFQDNHGCLPTEACFRWWEHSNGTPPRLVIEAKAIGKSQRRKRA